MKNNLLLALLGVLLALGPDAAAQHQKTWYKGNLHTHSYWSDGDEFPEPIMAWYKSHAYHFVALSDHNILAEGEKWITLSDNPQLRRGFTKYLEAYGPDWVEYREENGQIRVRLKTYAEYKPLFEEPGRFLILQAEEITDRFEKKPVHLNATNIQKWIEPQHGKTIVEVLQNNIDAVRKHQEETGIPILVHINHPNFQYALSPSDLIQLHGEHFFEVFNGHAAVHNLGDSLHLDTEVIWDLVNIAYYQQGKPLLYGLAVDDSHHYHEFGRSFCNAGRGWVMVQADTLSAAALIGALEAGRFYASTGVTLESLRFHKNKLTINVKKERGVHYHIQFIGYKKGESGTRILKEKRGRRACFKLNDQIAFVRAKIVSDKAFENPIETFRFEMAWAQPVGIDLKGGN